MEHKRPWRIEAPTLPMSKHIPEELIKAEILHRLPAKSVGRFRCVSKGWRSLLSSREFIKSHLNFNLRRHPRHLLVMRSDSNCYDVTLNSNSSCYDVTLDSISSPYFNEEDGTFRKVSCPLENESFFLLPRFGSTCHGLAVFSVGDGHVWFLMNPITGEALRVRKWPYGNVNGMVHGLGYDDSSDDYKIVNISWCLGGGERCIDVYSVRMNSWRTCPISEDGFKPCVPLNGASGVFVNGSIHWLGEVDDPSCFEGYDYRCVICAFSLAREEFEELQPPNCVKLASHVKYEIKLLGGCLALMLAPGSDQKFHSSVDVWLMKEYGVRDSWTKLTIKSPEDRSIDVGACEVVSFLNEDEVILSNKVKFFVYNCRSGIWRDLVVAFPSIFKAIEDSLVSPNYN